MEAEQARVKFYKESEKSLAAQVNALAEGEKVARASVKTVQVNQSYLQIVAPFAGTITERFVHPGALGGTTQPVLRLQQIARLRLIVAAPEAELAGVHSRRKQQGSNRISRTIVSASPRHRDRAERQIQSGDSPPADRTARQ